MNKPITLYFKLGAGASIFFDSVTRLKVVKGKVSAYTGKISKKMRSAMANGHIIEVDEPTGGNDSIAEVSPTNRKPLPAFGGMAKGEIVLWAQDNIEDFDEKLEEDGMDLEELTSLKKDELIGKVSSFYKED